MRSLLILFVGCVIAVSAFEKTWANAPLQERIYTVSITYQREQVYGGRLTNSKVAFGMLQKFFDTNPFVRRQKNFSFLMDALGSSMLPRQGYVMTMFGYGYGACGAPSLLNQLVNTAAFRDSDGREKPVFEVLVWKRENNRTYGAHGVAIFLDPAGKRTSDYKWRLNPSYDGPPPQLKITFIEIGQDEATVYMTMRYADEMAPTAADFGIGRTE